jgi:hypothetical protein
MKEKFLFVGAYAVPIGKTFRFRQRWWVKTDDRNARALTSERVVIRFSYGDTVGVRAKDLPDSHSRCILGEYERRR